MAVRVERAALAAWAQLEGPAATEGAAVLAEPEEMPPTARVEQVETAEKVAAAAVVGSLFTMVRVDRAAMVAMAVRAVQAQVLPALPDFLAMRVTGGSRADPVAPAELAAATLTLPAFRVVRPARPVRAVPEASASSDRTSPSSIPARFPVD
jgi:hypothetical protein